MYFTSGPACSRYRLPSTIDRNSHLWRPGLQLCGIHDAPSEIQGCSFGTNCCPFKPEVPSIGGIRMAEKCIAGRNASALATTKVAHSRRIRHTAVRSHTYRPPNAFHGSHRRIPFFATIGPLPAKHSSPYRNHVALFSATPPFNVIAKSWERFPHRFYKQTQLCGYGWK